MWEENLEILKFNARNIRFDEKVTKVCCHQDSVAIVLGFFPPVFLVFVLFAYKFNIGHIHWTPKR